MTKSIAKKTGYTPTPQELGLIEAYIARKKKAPPRVKATMKGHAVTLELDHPEPALGDLVLMDALGTQDTDFLDSLLIQLSNAGSQGRGVDEKGLNFMLSVVKGIEPKDQVEAMLAAQMAAVHMATMTFARRLAQVETIPQQDSAERTFNKLARTFTTQVEALKRYRTGGQQTVRVEHVTVNEGGQAIVGNVTHGGGRVLPKRRRRPHEPIRISVGATMHRDFEADRQALSGPCRSRMGGMPLSWSWWRWTEGRAQWHV